MRFVLLLKVLLITAPNREVLHLDPTITALNSLLFGPMHLTLVASIHIMPPSGHVVHESTRHTIQLLLGLLRRRYTLQVLGGNLLLTTSNTRGGE